MNRNILLISVFITLLVVQLTTCWDTTIIRNPGFRFISAPVITEKENEPQGQWKLSNTHPNKKCQCMNWRVCDGEIDSTVVCGSHYLQVCCIRAEIQTVVYRRTAAKK
ncbi:uncharacterized protein LOC112905986 [Agrilus planipennis]|uniref:Uncharacterized protein LOC112905986 n=1 Tax=Agrilus planipennis TaxID=224129 RepID=A0A7F5RH15_AGRPL|nr:uncharacterized protein LOC112905986 [Agrilus planipennis]